jgi:hypothetical protein
VQSSATSVDKSSPADPLQARVDAAAFALLREGRNPTVSQVRARMGGGSPNVVAPALQRWRLTFAGQLDENAGSALEVLPPGVLELVQALWSRALFEAHRVRADARSTSDALEQLNEAIHALHARTARLEEREATLDAELRALDQQRRRLTLNDISATAPRARPKPPRAGRQTKKARPKSKPAASVSPTKRRPQAARAAPKPTTRPRRAAARR